MSGFKDRTQAAAKPDTSDDSVRLLQTAILKECKYNSVKEQTQGRYCTSA
jgi:hypothetical protein